MALDHTLRDLAESDRLSVLRLYSWREHTLSLGANEAANRHWDRVAIERAALPVVRRPSGGRAVWHDANDLTYALTSPVESISRVAATYTAIHTILAAAIARLGLAATLAPPPARLPGLRRGACFDVAVGGEVLVAGKKVIGSAQVVTRSALLQHGSIARGDRLAPLRAIQLNGEDAAVDTTPEAWPLLHTTQAIVTAITTEWAARGAVPISSELTERADSASVKYRTHYSDPAWTWRR